MDGAELEEDHSSLTDISPLYFFCLYYWYISASSYCTQHYFSISTGLKCHQLDGKLLSVQLLVSFRFVNSLFCKLHWVSLAPFVPNALSKINISLITKMKTTWVYSTCFGIFYSIKHLLQRTFRPSTTICEKASSVSIIFYFSLQNISFLVSEAKHLLHVPYKNPGLLQPEDVQESFGCLYYFLSD